MTVDGLWILFGGMKISNVENTTETFIGYRYCYRFVLYFKLLTTKL